MTAKVFKVSMVDSQWSESECETEETKCHGYAA